MLFRLSNHLRHSPLPGLPIIVRPLLGRLTALAVLASGVAMRSEADPVQRPSKASFTVQRAPAPTPKMKISKRPHLVAIGPMEVSVQPLAGPRVRRPPLLPPPKVVEPEPEPAPATPPPSEQPRREPAEPSAFSPDAPPVLLPTEKPPATPAPEKREEPRESVLVPAGHAEPDLKDAVIYFETPVGPRGSQISVPAMVPFSSPAAVTQPQSRAIYRKEKE